MSDDDVDASWVPEADRAEQELPADPEAENATGLPDALPLDSADEADLLEQASPVPLGEDDYRA